MMRKLLLKSYTFDLASTNSPSSSEPSPFPKPNITNRHPPWCRSSSQPATLRNNGGSTDEGNNGFKEISDGNWTYCYESESGIQIKGFGNVPIVSYEDIAKMPDRRLKTCCLTWNMNEKPAKILSHLAYCISDDATHNMDSDIFFITLQEISSTAKTFHEDALKILGPCFKSHSLYLSHRAWSQMVIVFIRTSHLKYAIQPQVSFIASGAMAKPVRTKGAIAVCLRIYQRWIVFIGCHLSHATSQQRIQDYQKIVKTLRFVALKKFHAHGNDDLFSADAIFWSGDLNFRVTTNDTNNIDWHNFDKIDDKIFDHILEGEELATLRGKGLAFSEFAEPTIRFPPTHKFEPDSDEYVSKRIPSFTDRILYWDRNSDWIQPIKYDSIRGPCPSDHKPVFGTFWLTVINKPIPRKYYSTDSRTSILSGESTISLPANTLPPIEHAD